MQKQITKKRVKNIIKNTDFLSTTDKEKWFDMIETLNQKNLENVFNHFKDSNKKENDKRLKLLFEADLADEFEFKTTEITNKNIRKVAEKEENYDKETSENPEEILKKLENL